MFSLLSRIVPVLGVLGLQVIRSLLRRGNELAEQFPVVRVRVQILLRNIEGIELVDGVIVARRVIEFEALGIQLLRVCLE